MYLQIRGVNLDTLTHQEARQTYDRIGSLQDSQGFYEDRATELVLLHGNFTSAESVFEFGFGTGRFALRLFDEYLSDTASYRAVDVSPKMLRLAQTRLVPFSSRAEVILTEGGPPVDEPTEHYDRFVSNYVFDLLSHEDIRAVLREAHRMLRPDGLLCLSGLSTGIGFTSRIVAGVVSWIQAHSLADWRLPSCGSVTVSAEVGMAGAAPLEGGGFRCSVRSCGGKGVLRSPSNKMLRWLR